jgi:membrane protein
MNFWIITLKYIARVKQRILRRVQKMDERAGGWLGILARAATETLKPEAEIIAAAIAYFALFSLFPITLLSVAVASFSIGQTMDQQFIIRRLEFVAPNLGQLLGQNIDEIIKARGPVTGVALVGLIWSASTVFYTFNHTLNEIWGMKQYRAVWRKRGTAILFVLIIVGPALFLASFAGSMVFHLSAFLPKQILAMGGGFTLVLSIALDIALFMSLYMMLPHGAATRREFYSLFPPISPPRIWSTVRWRRSLLFCFGHI